MSKDKETKSIEGTIALHLMSYNNFVLTGGITRKLNKEQAGKETIRRVQLLAKAIELHYKDKIKEVVNGKLETAVDKFGEILDTLCCCHGDPKGSCYWCQKVKEIKEQTLQEEMI